jgi:nitronate monooxygenase
MEEFRQSGKSLLFKTDPRTRLFDDLRGKSDWLASCDGRAIINDTLREHEIGIPDKEIQKKYDAALKDGDYNRLAVYAGTGSGLITKLQSAGEILAEMDVQLEDRVKFLTERFQSL